MRFSPRTTGLIHSPIGAAHALLAERDGKQPLLDLSQAAPAYPPARAVQDRIAAAAHEATSARYAPQPGLPELRQLLAADLTSAYLSTIEPDDTLITAGCNQAFCITTSALAGPGDNVLIADPFYFNHDMWLRVEGIEPRHVDADTDHLPDPDRAAAQIDSNTRAIVLVSPGNPTGVTIPPERIHTFAEIARRHDVALIVDETYRNFRPTTEPAHDLFANPDWRDTVISLHSFSKDLAIPGHRVGAVVAGESARTEALKVLDCIAISATWIGQEACITGLRETGPWRAEQRQRIGQYQEVFEAVMSDAPGGFTLESAGAYFGWVRAPGAEATADVVRRLVVDHDILAIPGTAFTRGDHKMLRLSFANLDHDRIAELGRRLSEWEAR